MDRTCEIRSMGAKVRSIFGLESSPVAVRLLGHRGKCSRRSKLFWFSSARRTEIWKRAFRLWHRFRCNGWAEKMFQDMPRPEQGSVKQPHLFPLEGVEYVSGVVVEDEFESQSSQRLQRCHRNRKQRENAPGFQQYCFLQS